MNSTDDTPKLSLIDRLKCFNAKERYWVVHAALGHFKPSREFLEGAAKAAGVAPPAKHCPDESIFLAMDYHLNWLCAALWVALTPSEKAGTAISNKRTPTETMTPDHSTSGPLGKDRALMENSQEDVDLLLAYPRPDGVTQVILIEAKCTGSFTKNQLGSKFSRLEGILGSIGKKDFVDASKVSIKMILMSPNRPPSQTTSTETDATQFPAMLIQDARSNSEDAIPWLPLMTTSPDPGGFWFVKFGGSGKEEAESIRRRQQAGKDGKSWYWPEPSLQYRKFGSKSSQADAIK
jgi:hypothetical protein